MVSHCANPGCRAQFIYFRRGRLFAAPRNTTAKQIEYFWLCGDCSEDMDLAFGHDHRPTLVRRHSERRLRPRADGQADARTA